MHFYYSEFSKIIKNYSKRHTYKIDNKRKCVFNYFSVVGFLYKYPQIF